MPLTRKERSAVNKKNAQGSTGPKSPEGKNASRRNALKHGLRAKLLALPNEDPAAIQAREDAWNDYYQPQSPAAQQFVNECARATLMTDRLDRHHAAVLSKQARDAREQWDRAREDEVEGYWGMLKADPGAALTGLKRSAAGCRLLITEWERLSYMLEEEGWWSDDERNLAVRLIGKRPERLKDDEEAWVLALFVTTMEPPHQRSLNWIFDRDVRPASLCVLYGPENYPDPEQAMDGLRRIVAANLEPLRAREQRLRTEFDEPDRAEAADRALTIEDGPSARLFLRYHSEARATFHRAYSELVKTLARDAAEDEDENEDEEATTAAEPSEAGSPNEPNLDTKPVEKMVFDESSGAVAVRPAAAEGAESVGEVAEEQVEGSNGVQAPAGWALKLMRGLYETPSA